MRRKNPFPGVSRFETQHKRIKWRFRMTGKKSGFLPGEYGSIEFRAAYEKFLADKPLVKISKQSAHGTFSWLIEQYYQTPDWQRIGKVYKRVLRNEVERFRNDHGEKMVRDLKRIHVEAMISKKHNTPAAANKHLKLLGRFCRYAIRLEIISIDPARGVKGFKTNPDGFHTWTDSEVLQFETCHGINSKPVLAMRLVLCTGAARQDVIRLGWQSIKNGRIQYKRGKTGGVVDLPIIHELSEVIENASKDEMLFLFHGKGRAYKPETFGAWFRQQCLKAMLPHCSSHGLRKAGATRLANAGGTEFEVMAFLGHKTPQEARTYTQKADRRTLGDSGMKKITSLSHSVKRFDKGSNK